MNSIVLSGRTTADPELRFTQTGTPVANFSMAVDRFSGGEKETEFFRIVLWGKAAEATAEHLIKGQKCMVQGELRINEYENKEGVTIRTPEIHCNMCEWGEKPMSASTEAPAKAAPKKSYTRK